MSDITEELRTMDKAAVLDFIERHAGRDVDADEPAEVTVGRDGEYFVLAIQAHADECGDNDPSDAA